MAITFVSILKQKLPMFGLFTPYTLRFHTDYYKENSSALLKRSLVLFDQMVYVEPRVKDKNFVEEIIVQDDPDRAPEILENFIPINEFITENQMSEISFVINPDTNMFYGPNHERYRAFMRSFLLEKFGIDQEKPKDKNEFEIIDYYFSALSADFNFLFQLSDNNSDLSALYTVLHRDAYFATYENVATSPERVLSKICSINYFDFGKLSWVQIIELKRSKFLQDFRSKFYEWVKEYNNSADEQEFERKIDQYIKGSNFEFLKQHRPKLSSDVASGVLGNLPIPYVNPISIYSSIKQLRKDIAVKKDFGWLFFIQEAFSKAWENKI